MPQIDVPKTPLADQWDTYRVMVVPGNAGQTQLRATRRAFMAGAEAMRRVLLNAPDDERLELVLCDNVDAELTGFAEAVLAGKA